MSKVKSKIEALTDDDFLPGLFDSWSITIRETEFSLEGSYMNIGFTSQLEAEQEKNRIIRHRINQSLTPYFSITVNCKKVRRLKTPISIS